MDIRKVVIHSLDEASRSMVLSQRQVNLNTFQDVENLIEKLLKSFQNSASVSKAILNERSQFKALIGTQFNFLETAHQFAKEWFTLALMGEEVSNTQMIFAQVDQGDTALLVCLEMRSRSAFVKVTESETSIENALVHNHAVISDTFGGVKSGFVLDLNTGDLIVKAKEDLQDQMMDALDCQIYANSKATFNIVDGLVRSISEKRQQEPTQHILKAKQVVSDHMVMLEEIRPDDILSAVYEDLSEAEKIQIDTTLVDEHAAETLLMKDLKRGSIIQKHKIYTESGVEIILPVDGINIHEILEVSVDEKGRTNVLIKNVGKVM